MFLCGNPHHLATSSHARRASFDEGVHTAAAIAVDDLTEHEITNVLLTSSKDISISCCAKCSKEKERKKKMPCPSFDLTLKYLSRILLNESSAIKGCPAYIKANGLFHQFLPILFVVPFPTLQLV